MADLEQIADDNPAWEDQIRPLLTIINMRHDKLQTEPYPFVIWWICLVDIGALLSSSGSGTFTKELLRQNLIPPSNEIPRVIEWFGYEALSLHEQETFFTVMELHYSLSLLSARIGLLGQHVKASIGKSNSRSRSKVEEENLSRWSQDAADLRQEVHEAWQRPFSGTLAHTAMDKTLPWRVHAVFEQVST